MSEKIRTTQTRSPPQSGVPPPHESTATIPSLRSAPSSGVPFSTESFKLPPPPPPPSRSSRPAIHTTTTSPPSSSSLSPLPPPPNLSPSRISKAAPPSNEKAPTAYIPPPFLPITTFAPPSVQILAKRHTHIPILVIATEQAKRLAWKNDLQLIDLFQGIAHNLQVGQMPPFRSLMKSLTLSDVPFQFIESMEAYNNESAHDLLQENAKLQDADGNVAQDLVLLEDRVDELLQDRGKDETLEQTTKDAYNLTSPLDIPWLQRYRHALDESTRDLPHDYAACPPLILLVCSTQEVEAPEEVFQELYNSPHVLPTPFKNGLFDASSVRHEVLVLHDAVDGPQSLEESMLRQSLQSRFGSNAAVLRINSVLPGTAKALAEQEKTDLWGGNGKKGNCLSVNDRVLLRRYFQKLVTTSLLPALERRIADLNAVVSERKKGVRNLVKSFWRKPKEEGLLQESHTDFSVKYRYDSIESQTRLLADTLFMMQDYESALSTYRLIRDDYKSDKALTHYANVQEMMAICMYHLDPFLRAKEIFSCLETALLSYTRAAEEERASWGNAATRPKAAPHATRLATRLCLLLATASDNLTKGRELEVADLLASASSHESSLGAAVLLEQSSAFYYHAGMYRKYAFHMLMSGHMFRTANQDHHAFRCFTSALYIYRHGQWNELHNHLRSALAAQLYTMGRMSLALVLYAKLVGTTGGGKVSSKSQQKFLHHILEICEKHPKSALAGADRMAAPPSMDSKDRESFRNQQLERIVQVIRYTPQASRVLELPYMDLPQIVDKSVRIWTYAEQGFVEEEKVEGEGPKPPLVEFGKACKGKDDVWDALELMTTSELNASDSSKAQSDETISAALSKIEDPYHRRVIAQIDKEKGNRNLIERNKRNGSIKPSPAVRARGEPIFCDFVLRNPLGVEIEVGQLQLVAKMVDNQEHLCTNEGGIRIQTLSSTAYDQTWTFASTDLLEFSVADFCRLSAPNERKCKSAEDQPFFVVTKRSLNLAPGGETVVSAGLTPLVEGNLEILGVRCKLFNKVWVYHSFDIQGPLLQNNRTNRANRVRGEPMVLKSKIEVDMPCLTAELVKRMERGSPVVPSDGGPLLEGQISSWTILLRNVGSAPASSLYLKTNFPWVNLLCTDKDGLSVEEMEAQATSNCLGPTGTLITLPIKDDSLQVPGTIHPGESIKIPIQIRTSGTGKQNFYMLYRYDLWDPSGQLKRKRWLRKVFEVPVYPSLDLGAKISTSFWKADEQMISVELTNNRTDRPTDLFLTLDKLSLVSRHHRLEALPGQFSTAEKAANVVQIGWQERLTVHYRVIELEVESKTCLLSGCSFSEDADSTTKECVATGATNYLCLERACETFDSAWKNHQFELARAENEHDGAQHPRSIASIRRANLSDTVDRDASESHSAIELHPTSIGRLCPPESSASKIHVVCSWRAILGEEVIHGEHHLRGVPIRPVTFFNGCPVSAVASHPSTVSHDFSKGPAIVPMKVTLRNRMLESPVKFYVSVEEYPAFELIGLDMLRLSLEAREETTIPIQALIPRAGVYNLQALHLTVRQNSEERAHRLQQQWLVSVADTQFSN